MAGRYLQTPSPSRRYRSPSPREDEKEKIQEGSFSRNGDDGRAKDNILFSCRCDSARAVSMLLSCLLRRRSSSRESSGTLLGGGGTLSTSFGDTTLAGRRRQQVQMASVFVSANALTFHVRSTSAGSSVGTGGYTSQSSVEIQSGLFADFYVIEEEMEDETEEEERERELEQETNGHAGGTTATEPKRVVVVGGEFRVDLTSVMECLGILGSSSSSVLNRTSLSMSYDRSTAIFKVEVEEMGVLSTCAVAASEPDDEDIDDEVDSGPSSLTEAFRNDPVVARAVLRSEFLKEATNGIAEVDGAEVCALCISPDGIELGATGHAEECLVELYKSPEVCVDTSLWTILYHHTMSSTK
uniref:Uncharacterized protein n=1 Tax=Corethron hystrix TaxID=216773 RepID=A0A6U5DWW6_9STRA